MSLPLFLVGLLQIGGSSGPPGFLEAAREGTLVYRDISQAIADGFRAVGPESPAMGQHWVNVRRLMDGRLAAGQPAILTYAFIHGKPVLVGVAYALALAPGQAIPVDFGDPHHWHVHSGTISEEALLVTHDGHGIEDRAVPRVAVLHAWVWLKNPAGPFAPDNWALPLVRADLPAPEEISPDVSRAIALSSGWGTFFADQYGNAARLDTIDREAIHRIFAKWERLLQRRLRDGYPPAATLAGWWVQALEEARHAISPEGRSHWP